jgi:ABC-2 type transport system permease protein
MLFLSGAAMNINTLTGGMRVASEILPLTHAIRLMRGVWLGAGWGAHTADVVYLVAFTLVGGLVVSRTFRWDP